MMKSKKRMTREQLVIARYLAKCAVRPTGEVAAAALGLTQSRWWALVNKGRWFTFDAPGPAGWSLTPDGVAALAELDKTAST